MNLILSQFISKSNILVESETQKYDFNDFQTAMKFAMSINANSSIYLEKSSNSYEIKDQQIYLNKSLLLEFFHFLIFLQ